MKHLLMISILIVLSGCDGKSKEYKEFVETYGSETRTFCEDGFKMRERFVSEKAIYPQRYLINSQECK